MRLLIACLLACLLAWYPRDVLVGPFLLAKVRPPIVYKLNKLNKLKTSKPERIITCFSPYVTGESKNSFVTCYCYLIFQAALKGGIPPLKVALIFKPPLKGQLANFTSL